jgi:hypothetical protein
VDVIELDQAEFLREKFTAEFDGACNDGLLARAIPGIGNASCTVARKISDAISSPCKATIPLLTNGGSNTSGQCRSAISRR